MKSKVLPETSVLVSASIKAYISDLGKEVKHKFYDQCKALFGFLQQRPGTGIRTARVIREARRVLVRAFEETLVDEVGDKLTTFRGYSVNLSRCQSDMKKLAYSLVEESIIEDNLWYAILLDIARMYQNLEDMYLSPDKMRIEAGKRSWPSPFKGRLKKIVWRIRMEELHKRNEMIKRLQRKYPSDVDMEILADAVYIQRRQYLKTTQVFIASCDTGAFSPTRLKGGIEMRLVPDAIRYRFGVICDWPNQIQKMALDYENS